MELHVGDIVQLSDKFMQCMQRGAASDQMFPAFAAANGLAEVVVVDGRMASITPAKCDSTVTAKADRVLLVLEAAALAFMGCYKLNANASGNAAAATDPDKAQELSICDYDTGVEARPGCDSGLPHPFALGRVPAVVAQAYWIYGGAQSSKQQYASQASQTYEAGLRYRREGDDEVRPASIAIGECEQQLLITSTNIIGEYMVMQFETFKAGYAAAKGAGDFFGAVSANTGRHEPVQEAVLAGKTVCPSFTVEPQTQDTFAADW